MGRVRFLTAGESHGQTLAATIEGIPAGLPLTADQIAVDLARRQRGYGRGARQAIEKDRAEILSGVRHGLTIGSPILLLIANRDWDNWTSVMSVEPLTDEAAAELLAAADEGNKRATPVTRVRPGHADLAGALKYGFNDVRNVLERASARETTARVAAGGVARAFLAELGIEVWSFTAEVGGVAVDPANASRSRDEADAEPVALPGSRCRGADDRPDRRGALERRHGRRRVRGGGPRPADRSRELRPLGSPARRGPGRRRHEHQHRQGRRIRPGLRADPPFRLRRPRRHRPVAARRAAGSITPTTPAD